MSLKRRITIQAIRLLLSMMMFTLAVCGYQKTPISSAQPETDHVRIRLTYEGGEATAVLEDNPTTQSLLSKLPATVTFEDFAGAEKIAYFSENLSVRNAPKGYDPVSGDITCYGPWGNMAIFYSDQPYAAGLIPMGKIESGLEELATLDADVKVTIVLID